MLPPLIDVRPEPAFLLGHIAGAANFPLEELAQRVHELPPISTPLGVTDSDEERLSRAANLLRTRGHEISVVVQDSLAMTETGASRIRLWRPNAFLIESLERVAIETGGNCRKGLRALDVACGSGRDAVYLALQGFDMDAIDLLPDALEKALDLARRSGVRINYIRQDLERNPILPSRRYDLACVFRYLQRSLFAALRDAIVPGGFLIYETFHESNRLTGQRPSNPDHLLRTSELSQAFADFHVLISEDAVEREGRFFSHILARRNK